MNTLIKIVILIVVIGILIIVKHYFTHSREGFRGGGGGGRGGRWSRGGRGWRGYRRRGGHWPYDYDDYDTYLVPSFPSVPSWILIGTITNKNDQILNLYQNDNTTTYRVAGNGKDISFKLQGYIVNNQTINVPGLNNPFIVHIN
jgi:hypothetical protein